MSSTSIYPVRLVAGDDLQRSRLTVFFRIILLIPHAIVLYAFRYLAWIAAVVAWVLAVILGRVPEPLHKFLAAYVRFSLRFAAYVSILANPYPPFFGGRYVVDLDIDPPQPQRRLGVFFRLILALPCLILSGAMNLLVGVIAVGNWFVALFRGQVYAGPNALGLFCLRFSARASSFAFLLTSQYPTLGDPFEQIPSEPGIGTSGSLSADQTSLPPIP